MSSQVSQISETLKFHLQTFRYHEAQGGRGVEVTDL